jgi:hypothetical protein
VLVVDPWHWLQPDGSLPEEPRLRTQTLRVARLIEAGGPLRRHEARQSLVECEKRQARRPCRSLLIVVKTGDDDLRAFCLRCGADDTLISNWATTPWAKGPTPAFDLRAPPEDEDDGTGAVH